MAGDARLPAGLRWTCSGCGACCSSGLRLGPVEPEVVARLRAEDIGARWAPAANGFVDQAPDGAFLRQTGGRCVFLRDDDLCAVHALLGADAKPGFCREFPYYFVDDPRGTVAVVRGSCEGFARSSVAGPVVTAADARDADVARILPRRRFAPERVEALPGHAVGLDRWMALEDGLLAALGAADEGPAGLAGVARRWLVAELGAEAVPVRPEQARAAEEALLRALRIVMGQVVGGPGGTPEQRAFAAASLERIVRAHDAVGTELAWGADERRYANLLLRSAVLSKRFATWGGVTEGLGAFVLGSIVALRCADGDLGASWAAWERFEAIELVTALLRRARPALVDLVLHA